MVDRDHDCQQRFCGLDTEDHTVRGDLILCSR